MINKDWQYLILSRVLFTGVRFVARFSRLRLWSAGAPSHGRWAVLGNSLLRVVSSSSVLPLKMASIVKDVSEIVSVFAKQYGKTPKLLRVRHARTRKASA